MEFNHKFLEINFFYLLLLEVEYLESFYSHRENVTCIQMFVWGWGEGGGRKN